MTVLDLFCGAGLAADGYQRVGLPTFGVDVDPRALAAYPSPRRVQADALSVLALYEAGYLRVPVELVHASPPCQAFTRAKHLRDAQGGTSRFDDLLTPTLAAVRRLEVPWVVENVEDKAVRAIMAPRPGEYLTRLCGSSFGLGVKRHRLFLTNFPVAQPACAHHTFEPDPVTGKPRPWGVYHVPGDSIPQGGRTARNADHARDLMGVGRSLTWNQLKEGFPPAYTRHVASALLEAAA